MRVFVVFTAAIYARGLQASPAHLPDVNSVDYALRAEDAMSDATVAAADVVVLDCELPGAGELAHAIYRVRFDGRSPALHAA